MSELDDQIRSEERLRRCSRADVSNCRHLGCAAGKPTPWLLRLIPATFAVIAPLVLGSPVFASDPNGNGAAWPIPTRASSRQVSHTPVLSGQLAQLDEAKALIASHHAEIFDDPDSPVGGSDSGDVTIVEFFDYNCPYCRLAAPTLQEIERTDPKVKFVYKEFPILGPGSEFAARAALAANRQGKYVAFHWALMASDEKVGESTTMEVARSVGLDIARLKRDMDDPRITAAIERNLALARALRIAATPSFVINDGIFRGAADLKAFRGVIAEARGQ